MRDVRSARCDTLLRGIAARGAYNCGVKRLLVVFSLLVAGCSNDAPPAGQSAPVAALPAGFTRVADASQVCMVNDQFMGRPQIPVEVQGRTYYGCCAMCKDKLDQQPAVRTAQDPVTGEPVDKAQAVIIHDASGKVLYFANESTLRQYRG